jgi:type IV pilus assembly protein PilA
MSPCGLQAFPGARTVSGGHTTCGAWRRDGVVDAWWGDGNTGGRSALKGTDEEMANEKQRGFTLIELLVVVAIVAILAAIAIPAFSAYRADGYNAHAVAGLNSLAKAEEAYFASNGRYTAVVAQLPPYYPPNGIVLTINGVTTQGFLAQSHHPLGSRTYSWNSNAGGLQP